MKAAPRLALQLFRLLLALHPRQFRIEFGAEMLAVFQARLDTAAGHGFAEIIAVCLHESSGLVASLVREHGAALHKRQRGIKHTRSIGPGLILFALPMLGRQIIASYFCDLVDPQGGGLGNRAACTVFYQDPGGNLLTIVGAVALAVGLVLMLRESRRRQIT